MTISLKMSSIRYSREASLTLWVSPLTPMVLMAWESTTVMTREVPKIT